MSLQKDLCEEKQAEPFTKETRLKNLFITFAPTHLKSRIERKAEKRHNIHTYNNILQSGKPRQC